MFLQGGLAPGLFSSFFFGPCFRIYSPLCIIIVVVVIVASGDWEWTSDEPEDADQEMWVTSVGCAKKRAESSK